MLLHLTLSKLSILQKTKERESKVSFEQPNKHILPQLEAHFTVLDLAQPTSLLWYTVNHKYRI